MHQPTTINPFDNEDHLFYVLCNHQQQSSLWPTFAAVPADWQVNFGPARRVDCLNKINEHATVAYRHHHIHPSEGLSKSES